MKKIEDKSKPFEIEMIDGYIKVDMGGDDVNKLYSSLVGVENKAIFNTSLTLAIESLPSRFTKDDAGNFVIGLLQDIAP